MRMYDIILKKRNGNPLSKEEISFLVEGYTKGDIPDYQMSAFLMAVYFKKMDSKETAYLTENMTNSGDVIDLSEIKGVKVDKHSTGGVGDKTSLIICPVVASLGVPVAKMSGRGLGHTGGTVDKLESIPGYQTSLEKEEFFKIVNEIGISIIGQTGNIAPADKKLYALRDVTATVDNISLIASSIMSKKLASGSDAIVLDVKTGSGAFMKTTEEALELAKVMVDIGVHMGKKMSALVTNMNIPLGNAIGNSLEIKEVIDTLKGKGPDDLTYVCNHLAADMLHLATGEDIAKALTMVKDSIETGKAFNKFKEMVEAQGGDISYIDNTSKFKETDYIEKVIASEEGYISGIDTEKVGILSVTLGAGRTKKDEPIDHSAGIVLNKKVGEKIEKGDVLAHLYTNDEKALNNATGTFLNSININKKPIDEEKLIFARVTGDKTEYF